MAEMYKDFGKKLKQLREREHKSIMEVSGAVEHEPEHLQKIEDGLEQPSEELVVLLVSHFGLEDSEALSLWKLAGYANMDQNTRDDNKPTSVFLPLPDAKIVYTDMVNVSANKYGVTVNFLQGLGANSQPMAVSRVGMSLEHAKSFLKILEDTVNKISENENPKPPKQIE